MCNTPEKAEESLRGAWHEIHDLKKQLYGNGRPGLVERFSAVERNQAITNRLLLAVFTVAVGIFFKMK